MGCFPNLFNVSIWERAQRNYFWELRGISWKMIGWSDLIAALCGFLSGWGVTKVRHSHMTSWRKPLFNQEKPSVPSFILITWDLLSSSSAFVRLLYSFFCGFKGGLQEWPPAVCHNLKGWPHSAKTDMKCFRLDLFQDGCAWFHNRSRSDPAALQG